MKKIFTVIVLLLLLSPLFAKDEGIRLTIYNRGISQVSLVREVKLDKGENWIIFDGISPKIIPETMSLIFLDKTDKLSVIHSGYTHQPVDEDKLWKLKLGEPVELKMEEDTVSGVLLNFDDDYFYLETSSRDIRLVKRSGVDFNTFPPAPGWMTPDPTAKFLLSNSKSGDYRMELNYLTTDLSWFASYTAVLSGAEILLAGEFQVENDLPIGFDGAELSFIAGEPHMAYDREELPTMDELASGDSKGIDGEPLYAYYIYPVTVKLDLPPFGYKRIPFLKQTSFKTKRINLMKEGFGQRNLVSVQRFTAPNIPLPDGEIGVYRMDKNGRSVFIGEDHIDDTPPGDEVEVVVGQNFNLIGSRERISHKRIDRNMTEDKVQVSIYNGSSEDADVVIRERLYGFWEVLRAEFNGVAVKYETKDARKIEFNVIVKANSRSTLEYTVRYGY
ncbi:hypothetical protein ISS30_00705 [bacterium]|nr:hypothetical protein [FCB group bacterium]MBL7190191.1 hypothetical protein [bacterium]